MNAAVQRELQDEVARLRSSAEELNGPLKDWCAPARVIAARYTDIADRIEAVLWACAESDRISEKAGGFDVLERLTVGPKCELRQRVRYRKTGREENQIWSKEYILSMSAKEYARKIDGAAH